MSDEPSTRRDSHAAPTRPTVLTPWVRGLIGRYGLPFWFVVMSAARIGDLEPSLLGTDAELYVAAARQFMNGLSPWEAAVTNGEGTFHYAGAPPTVLLTAPLTVLPDPIAASVLWACGLIAGVLTVRMLKLPAWWLAFPPLVEGVFVGNPHTIVLAMLIGGPRFIAPLLKAYAAVPLLVERRLTALLAAVGVAVASIALAPALWKEYVQRFSEISQRLLDESHGGFSALVLGSIAPALVVITVACLAVVAMRDLRRAGWLAVPALWPATQFMYASFLMPIARPLSAALAAMPIPAGFVIVVAVEAIRAARRPGAS